MTQNLSNLSPKIALFEPDIPQNTAAIIRTCACLGAKLEIIEPCGFLLSDKRFKKNIETSNAGLAVINDLRPVTYNWKEQEDVPEEIRDESEKDTKIRRGNIRARLRMVTLYNLASLHKGFVASTDNFSELAAGFWTLHGDVGDVAPIQSLTKSWEVPAMAELQGVPESIILAKPTDGLGVANGDEDQFGCSYLELDIGLLSRRYGLDSLSNSERMKEVYNIVDSRVGSTTYKRINPSNLNHPTQPNRYDLGKS